MKEEREGGSTSSPLRFCFATWLITRVIVLSLVISSVLRPNSLAKTAGVGGAPRTRRHLLEADPVATLILYPEGQVVPPGGPEDGGGCIELPGHLPPGTKLVEGRDNIQPTFEACCRSCRTNADCNAFSYCGKEAGCFEDYGNFSTPFQGCDLIFQALSDPATGRPILVVTAPDFLGGAPIRLVAPEIKGYDTFPGLGFYNRFNYVCDGTITEDLACGLKGTPVDLASRCTADPYCQAMAFFPKGRDYIGYSVTVFKGGEGVALSLQSANFNANAVLYMKQGAAAPVDQNGGSGAGISTGAIVGIAVGASCAVGLAAGLGVMMWRRWRRKRWIQRISGHQPDDQVQEMSSCKTDAEAVLFGSSPAPSVMGKQGGAPPDRGQASGGSASLDSLGRPQGGPRSLSRRSDVEPASLEAGTQQGGGAVEAVGQPPATAAGEHSGPGLPVFSAGGSVQWSVGDEAGSGKRLPADMGSWGRPDLPALRLPEARPRLSDSSSSRGAGSSSTAAGPPGSSPLAPGSSSASASDTLPAVLSRLPDDPLLSSSCVVEYSQLQFCRDAAGKYVELGSGAFSTVYRVLLDDVQQYAAKILHLGSDPRQQDKFLKEAAMLRQIRHRNVVGFAGVCVAEGMGIILMELMEGRDLHSRLDATNRAGERLFSWHNRGKTVAVDVARALHYLHSHSLIHLDIKSSNVLLTRDLTAKLADVGFTRALHKSHLSSNEVDGQRIGTFDYVAPELLLARSCTSAVDIFSYGCLLWEICSGEHPARGRLRQLRVPEEAPQEVAELCLECMDEDPAKRPTARDLVQRLSRLLAEHARGHPQDAPWPASPTRATTV